MLQKAVGKFFCEVAIEPVSYLVVRIFEGIFAGFKAKSAKCTGKMRAKRCETGV